MNKHPRPLARPLTCCRRIGSMPRRVQVCRGGFGRTRAARARRPMSRGTLWALPRRASFARQAPVEHTNNQLYAFAAPLRNIRRRYSWPRCRLELRSSLCLSLPFLSFPFLSSPLSFPSLPLPYPFPFLPFLFLPRPLSGQPRRFHPPSAIQAEICRSKVESPSRHHREIRWRPEAIAR